jgi:protease-4
LDKDTLCLSSIKGKLLLSVVFIALLISALAIPFITYSDVTHESLIPVQVSQYFSKGGQDKIAVIYLEGQMASDKSSDSSGSVFSSDIVKYLRKATDDPSIKAIVLRVNSPGGTPVAAEEIISQIHKTRAVKPIIVSMGDMAASAAYYVSSQTNLIVADPDTFTGSIGVIWTFENKTKQYNDSGVSYYVAKSGAFKDMGSDKRGLTDNEKAYIQSIINESYERFVDNVAAGRNMTVDQVKAIADGRVYTGTTAKELGLVDDLGGLYDAISIAQNMTHIKGNPVIVYMNEPSATASK